LLWRIANGGEGVSGSSWHVTVTTYRHGSCPSRALRCCLRTPNKGWE